jgi:hypothetical protein
VIASDQRAKITLEHFITPIEDEREEEEEKKTFEEDEKETKLRNDPAIDSGEGAEDEYF